MALCRKLSRQHVQTYDAYPDLLVKRALSAALVDFALALEDPPAPGDFDVTLAS